MIQANELRAGNYIYELKDAPESLDEKELFLVAAINTLTSTLIDVNENITQVEYCEPIPLTPELLQKAGFERIKNKLEDEFVMKKDRRFKWYASTREIDIELDNTLSTFNLYTNTSHLHQLQNLYFALTGEEIEIML